MLSKSSRTDGRLKIAIQKNGRLSEKSFALLEKAGISLQKSKDQLLCRAHNFPLDIFLVRDCLLYTSPSPRDPSISRMPSSA